MYKSITIRVYTHRFNILLQQRRRKQKRIENESISGILLLITECAFCLGAFHLLNELRIHVSGLQLCGNIFVFTVNNKNNM